jgi:hypothetical protein
MWRVWETATVHGVKSQHAMDGRPVMRDARQREGTAVSPDKKYPAFIMMSSPPMFVP